MRIAIDASSSAVPRKTGVARYILRLIENLEKQDDNNDYLICYRLSRWKKRKYFYKPCRETTRIKLFQEPLFTGRGIDVFHGPDVRLPRISGPKLVVTVHDVFSLVSDEFADEEFRKKKIARYNDIARRADRIICVSENTRSDFINFFPEAEPKIRVIAEGVDEQFYPRSQAEVDRVKEKYGIRSDYILYVGALSKRKNILRMFEAFHNVRRQLNEKMQFVAVGKLTYGREEILDYIRDNCCDDDILLTGYVPDDDLPALYSGARLFLFTTLYEGFGLPILEALACDTPVVTSNVSSMPEVGGDSVSTADPKSVDDITEKMLSCLNRSDAVAISGNGKAGLHSHISWSRMAMETSRSYAGLFEKE